MYESKLKRVKMQKYIAERKLLYSLKGSKLRHEFVIQIGIPYLVDGTMVSYPVTGSFAGCHVQIEGLKEEYSEVYGADSIQALNLATNLEPFLKRLQKQYDLFWASGEPYFEDE
jgi:hypothetical protein